MNWEPTFFDNDENVKNFVEVRKVLEEDKALRNTQVVEQTNELILKTNNATIELDQKYTEAISLAKEVIVASQQLITNLKKI